MRWIESCPAVSLIDIYQAIAHRLWSELRCTLVESLLPHQKGAPHLTWIEWVYMALMQVYTPPQLS